MFNSMSIADGRLFFLRPLMPRGHRLSRTPHAGGALTFLPTINFKAGASVDCLQAYAGGGSGLTKGKYGN